MGESESGEVSEKLSFSMELVALIKPVEEAEGE